MDNEMVRNNLREMLAGGAAHVSFDKAIEGFPVEKAGERIENLEHSIWMLVEHLRIVNRDLIDWVCAEEYMEKAYPSGYWPSPAPPSEEAWFNTIKTVSGDMAIMESWIDDPDFDISSPLKRRETHSALREILLTIAHNGYHIGQMVDLRALLGVPVKDW